MTPRTAIFSLIYGTQDESRHIFSNYSSYLPEYTLATADTIQAICKQASLLSIPVNMYVNTTTGTLHYKNTNFKVPETLFPNFYIFNFLKELN